MWKPVDESQACSLATALLEYRRATRNLPDLTPADMAVWQRDRPAEYDALMAEIRAFQLESGASAETSAAATSASGQGLPNR